MEQTDQEFRADLRNVVTGKLYDTLKSGSLVGHESTWQMAVSMAIGKVKAKFEDMDRTATGIAVWVNTLICINISEAHRYNADSVWPDIHSGLPGRGCNVCYV